MDLNRVAKIDDMVSVENVLISTADKRGLEEFVKNLVEINKDINIFSTGGYIY